MTVSDYSEMCDLLYDGSAFRSKLTGDPRHLEDAANILDIIRESLPITEQAKLHEARMKTGQALFEPVKAKIARLKS